MITIGNNNKIKNSNIGSDNKYKKILTELERALKDHKEIEEKTNIKEYYIEVDEVLDKIQELKEKYK